MNRGFLGPLGDDLPALFPIAMGLMLFFGAISLTFDYYTDRQETTNLMRANIALSKSIRQSGVLLDSDIWETGCNLLIATKANYGVQARMMLQEIDDTSGKFENSDVFSSLPTKIFPVCGDSDVKDRPVVKKVIAMSYPVLVPVVSPAVGNKIQSIVIETW